MSPFRIGFKIWGITVFLNAVYLCFVGIIMDYFTILVAFVALIAGMFVGLPFLWLLVQLIRLTRLFPYSNTARICWISFWVSVGVWLFYSAIAWLLDGKVDAEARQFAGTTIAAFLTSMWWSRKSFHEVDGMNEYSIN
jgi:hypothetical protein